MVKSVKYSFKPFIAPKFAKIFRKMNYKTIKKAVKSHWFQMGPLTVGQPMPSSEIENLNPFILLHHGRNIFEANSQSRLGPHPHRGFEPVTFLFDGEIEHRDSEGNIGMLEAGDVQWMTAGSGIIHSEGPSENLLKKGGKLQLIQLWVNLMSANKMTKPKYQDIKNAQMPSISENPNIQLKLVSGIYNDKKGPADTFSPIISIFGEIKAGEKISFEFESNWHTSLYILEGELLLTNLGRVTDEIFVVFNYENGIIELEAIKNTKILLLSAEPILEKYVAHGPFVMNNHSEINQAILDYQSGKMGVLDK